MRRSGCGRRSGAASRSSATGRATSATRRPSSPTRSRRCDESRGRRSSEIAVFYRTNAQSRAIEQALADRGVPYKVIGGTRFYDRREIRDALAYLRLVENPADEVVAPTGRSTSPTRHRPDDGQPARRVRRGERRRPSSRRSRRRGGRRRRAEDRARDRGLPPSCSASSRRRRRSAPSRGARARPSNVPATCAELEADRQPARRRGHRGRRATREPRRARHDGPGLRGPRGLPRRDGARRRRPTTSTRATAASR